MSTRLKKFLLFALPIALLIPIMFCGLFTYFISGGIPLRQENIKVDITNGSEKASVEWNSITKRRHLGLEFAIFSIVYARDGVYLEIQEDMFGTAGSGVSHTISHRNVKFDIKNGDMKVVDEIPTSSSIQDRNFRVEYPETQLDRAIKYEVEFYKNRELYWDVDVRTEPEFSILERLIRYEVYEDYYIVSERRDEGHMIYVFNIKDRSFAWKMEILNDELEPGDDSIYVDENNFYFVTERGGVIKIKSSR